VERERKRDFLERESVEREREISRERKSREKVRFLERENLEREREISRERKLRERKSDFRESLERG